MLGCRQAGFVAVNARTNVLTLGDFSHPGALVSLAGLVIILALEAHRFRGALLMGAILATVVGFPLGISQPPNSLFSLPFSTLGTTLAVGAKAGLTDPQGNLPHIERAFLVDSVAATLGPLAGIPALTALVESAAGAEAGGRTGLTAIVAAAGFAAMLFLTPLVLIIPKEATAPALIIIGISVLQTFRGGEGETLIDALPALLMMLLTLISNSFGIGIAGGVVFYVLVQILAGRIRELAPGLVLLALPLAYYLYGAATTH